jgi:hypothetical protein
VHLIATGDESGLHVDREQLERVGEAGGGALIQTGRTPRRLRHRRHARRFRVALPVVEGQARVVRDLIGDDDAHDRLCRAR